MLKYILIIVSLFSIEHTDAQTSTLRQSIYRAVLYRKDSNEIVFNMEVRYERSRPVFFIINDTERLRVTDIQQKGDSLFFNMPVFESAFNTKIEKDGRLTGIWIKGTRGEPQRWPFVAIPGQRYRFAAPKEPMYKSISGKWVVTFVNRDGTKENALAIFRQKNNRLTGSFLTATGDYRYLEGIVTNDSLKLSTFDGSHAYAFVAAIHDDNTISGGAYYFGQAGKQSWTAVKNNNAALPGQEFPTTLKKGETDLEFAFKDLNDQLVSLKDKRFRDKVIIVELMGSWCPNCMDETRFLSNYYKNNKDRGVEMIALAYEYTTDLQRSKASLEKFKNKFNVEYPMLITGVAVDDSMRTEKTLPQLTPIRSFPTTIYIDKKGDVRKIDTVFYGPGTGIYYDDFVREFNKTINELLAEN
jgi:thiol-disulfide isomerase/thioredoxin